MRKVYYVLDYTRHVYEHQFNDGLVRVIIGLVLRLLHTGLS